MQRRALTCKPSSVARALAAGVAKVERTDRIVQTRCTKGGAATSSTEQSVVDQWLDRNAVTLRGCISAALKRTPGPRLLRNAGEHLRISVAFNISQRRSFD
jgi:hypothetical protein